MRTRQTFASMVLLAVFIFVQVLCPYADTAGNELDGVLQGKDVPYSKSTVADEVYSVTPTSELKSISGSTVTDSVYYITPPADWDSIAWEKNWDLAEDNLHGITYGNGLYVAVGDSGAIKTSPDGESWQYRASGTNKELKNVVWNGDIFVAAGQGVLLTSANGIDWITQMNDDTLQIDDIAWNGSKFVAVGVWLGHYFQVYESADGISWSTSRVNEAYRSIVWGNGKFVAVTYGGIIGTSADGQTWTALPSGYILSDIAFDGNRFVIVGFDGVIRVSDDGITWNDVVSGTKRALFSVTWGADKFVAVGEGGGILTSSDGYSWVIRSSFSQRYETFESVIYNLEGFVIVGYNGIILKSSEGINWTREDSGTVGDFTSVAYNGWMTVAVTYNGKVLNTLDSITWNEVDIDNDQFLTSVIWDGNRFVATGYMGVFATSADGVAWNINEGVYSGFMPRDIAYDGTKYVAVGDNGLVKYISDDITWQNSAATSVLTHRILWNGSIFVAIQDSGRIWKSDKDLNWQMPYSDSSKGNLIDIAWNGETFVAVSNEAILTSVNEYASGWSTTYENDSNNGPTSITWDGNQFLCLCRDGNMLQSTNGREWRTIPTAYNFLNTKRLIWNGENYIAVGGNGLLMTGNPTNIAGVSIEKKTIKLEAGDTEKLNASIEPDSLDQTVIWTTSDANVATVSEKGLVTAKKTGTAIIRATCASNTAFYDECNVTVIQSIEEVKMSNKSFDLTVDAGLYLYVYILPYDATNNTITWTTTNASVASVSEAKVETSDGVTLSEVLVKGIGAGTATIRATSDENVNIYDECIITVTQEAPHVTGVEVDIDMAEIPSGNTLQLTATVLPESFENREVTWTTTDKSIATVSEAGLVRGISAGTARIRATSVADTAYYDECVVTVPFISVTEVELNKTTTNILVGTTEKLNASVLPENATNKAIVWTTTNASVASVSSDGLVTGVGVGTATIRATSSADGTKYAECEVIVNAPGIPVNQVTLNRSSASIYTGNILQLLVSVLPSDATDKRVTWTTSKPQIASVTQTGSVKGVGAGTAVIRATSVADASKYAECTVYVTDYIETPPTGGGGSGGGGGGGGGGAAGGSVVEVPKVKPQPTVANGTVSIDNMEVEGNGVLSTSITPDIIESAFSSAQTGTNGFKTIDIALQKVPRANAYSVGLPAAILTAASGTQNTMINITTEFGTVSLPNNMMTPEVAGKGSQVEMRVGKADINSLSPELRAKIGNRPVLDLSIAVDGKTKEWNNPDSPVTVTIDYTPTDEELENPDSIVVWYIDGLGNAVEIPSGRYDPTTGKLTFSVTHFSKYAVGFTKVSMNDIDTHKWAEKEINAVVVRGILKPVTDNSFAPGNYITRADFMYGLVRALGLTCKVEDNFDDIDRTDYYYNEIGIAKKLGISNGDGNNKFGADSQITRQDMMTMITRAINISRKTTIGPNQDLLNQYSDSDEIAAYARSSVAAMVSEGIIKGTGDRINPDANTSRAEAALIIYRIYSRYMK